MTCGECVRFRVCSDRDAWAFAGKNPVMRPANLDDDATDCPCFERKEEGK